MVQSWARELEALTDSEAPGRLSLELAVEEGFANAAQHAYPDGRPGPVHLEGSIDGQELCVCIRDEGVPFDPDSIPAKPDCGDPFGRVGLKLINHSVDSVRFINHGTAGKELHLVRYLVREVELHPEKRFTEVPQAPEQEYEVRSMRAQEALQIARVFWNTYGYSYKNENFYKPKDLLHLIGSGKVHSFVAVAEDGEVVGHCGLYRPEPVPTAEVAMLVVSPAHRGRGLMQRLSTLSLSEAKKMGLFGLSTNPVTSHPMSQKGSLDQGAGVCGLELAACPPRDFKSIVDPDAVPQRESYLNCFLHVRRTPPATVYIPQRHREIVAAIYQELKREVTFCDGEAAKTRGEFSVTFDRKLSKGRIRVREADPNQWPEIARTVDDLVTIGSAEVVNLELPLSQPGTIALWERAEQNGFFFTSIRPFEIEDGDCVQLQRLLIPFDLDRLRIYSEFGRELLDYVAAERERAETL